MKKVSKNINKAIFLDRDGTINYDKGYTYKFSKFKFRLNVVKGLKYLTKKKYLIFIVTNQAGIAKGKYRIEDVIKLHNKLIKYLLKEKVIINEIQFCPFHPNALIKKYKKKTNFRKPGNLMIKKIVNKWNVNTKKSFMIGDQKKDMIAAKKSGLYFQFVQKDFYKQIKKIINNY